MSPKPQVWKLRPSTRRPGWHTLMGPYNRDFDDELHQIVAAVDREFSRVAKLWYIRDGAVEDVRKLVAAYTTKPPTTGADAVDEISTVLARVGPAAPGDVEGTLRNWFATGVSELNGQPRFIGCDVHSFTDVTGKRRYVFVGIVEDGP
jgi:hypothetical protein